MYLNLHTGALNFIFYTLKKIQPSFDSFIVKFSRSESSVYTVIAPSKLRPNIPFHVSASAHNVLKPLDMKIAIEGPADSGQYNNVEKRITLNSGKSVGSDFIFGPSSALSSRISLCNFLKIYLANNFKVVFMFL